MWRRSIQCRSDNELSPSTFLSFDIKRGFSEESIKDVRDAGGVKSCALLLNSLEIYPHKIPFLLFLRIFVLPWWRSICAFRWGSAVSKQASVRMQFPPGERTHQPTHLDHVNSCLCSWLVSTGSFCSMHSVPQEGFPSSEAFLYKFLKVWDGSLLRPQILGLLSHIPVIPSSRKFRFWLSHRFRVRHLSKIQTYTNAFLTSLEHNGSRVAMVARWRCSYCAVSAGTHRVALNDIAGVTVIFPSSEIGRLLFEPLMQRFFTSSAFFKVGALSDV